MSCFLRAALPRGPQRPVSHNIRWILVLGLTESVDETVGTGRTETECRLRARAIGRCRKRPQRESSLCGLVVLYVLSFVGKKCRLWESAFLRDGGVVQFLCKIFTICWEL